MAEFISFDPNVEVAGQSMLSVLAGMTESAMPLIRKYHLENLDPQKWYPLQPILDFYKEISQSKNATLNLVSTGMKVPEKAVFPGDIDDIYKAFQALNVAYHAHHRGGDFGDYHYNLVRDRHIAIVAHNPFPCDLDYGIIVGLARRFKPPRGNLHVYHDRRGVCRKQGADQCTYHVTW
jgi:hypothetical protein